jgi:murein DD-endopeptidase MepM/ murein hydrolase activator NlpD
MITILQRQHVSKRNAPPVPARAQTVGVQWSRGEISHTHSVVVPSLRADRPISILALQNPKRSAPARISRRGKSGREKHSFLRDQLVRRTQRRRARAADRGGFEPALRRAEHAAESGAGGTRRRVIGSLLRNPWFYVVLAALAGLAFLVPALGAAGIGLARASSPALPMDADVDSALYTLQVPQSVAPASGTASPVLLDALKVGSYTTVAGDTLGKIAARFKLTMDTIVSWNGIRDARSLRAGTDLAIPSRDGIRYTVRRGDTLEGIARAWGVELNGILDANMLKSEVITIGQNLFLPGARMSPTELNRILGNLVLQPVPGRISSWFGERPDPFTGVQTLHNGLDIVNMPGTPILAAMAGRVRAAAFNFNYGNYVILQHDGGYQTLYGHLRRIVVTKGQKVAQGQEIGELGTTGYSTGPHLHFSIFKDGEAVDPLRFLK